MQKTSLYLAYGSNLNLEQMRWRCPTAEVVGTAQLQGYALLFRGGDARSGRGAVATIEPEEDGNVPVLIWEIQALDEQALDRYEGYPYFYHKEQMEVELAGKPVSVMAYVMNPGYSLGLPSEGYYQTIAQGYRSARFDLETLDAAVEESYQRSLWEEIPDFDEEQATLFQEDLEETEAFDLPDFMHL